VAAHALDREVEVGAHVLEAERLSAVDTTAPDFLQEALVPLDAETHSGTDVPVYASGPAAHLLTGSYEQNYIFHVMRHALRL